MISNDVYIIGGGASLIGFDFNKLKSKDCIAINYSIINVPTAKYFITMDYTFIDYIEEKTKKQLTRQSFFHSTSKKYFIVATNNSYIRYVDGQYTDIRSDYKYNLSGFDHIIASNRVKGAGDNFQTFVHGCNSGFCALQLAIILHYKKIHLLGFDLTQTHQTHYHQGYNQNKATFFRNLDSYRKHFEFGLKYIKEKFPNISIYNYAEEGFLVNYLETKSLESI